MLAPVLELTIRPDHISVRNLSSGQVASAEGPFSCEHLLVDDIDILQHVMLRALKGVAGRFWSFPRVTVSTAGRPIHLIEKKIIRDALMNAGASRVVLDETNQVLEERRAARSAYIDRAKRKR